MIHALRCHFIYAIIMIGIAILLFAVDEVYVYKQVLSAPAAAAVAAAVAISEYNTFQNANETNILAWEKCGGKATMKKKPTSK